MRPEFEHLVEGRHVYFWPEKVDSLPTRPEHRAAIVTNVWRNASGDPSGVVNLIVFSRDGAWFSKGDVSFFSGEDSPKGSGCWTWMFPEQSRVSTAGAKPTALEPPTLAEGVVGKANDIPDPWAHRSANMRCRTCMFFAPKIVVDREVLGGTATVKEVSAVGRCRRHAPTMGGYPVVYLNDWCGDHKLDETKV